MAIIYHHYLKRIRYHVYCLYQAMIKAYICKLTFNSPLTESKLFESNYGQTLHSNRILILHVIGDKYQAQIDLKIKIRII